MTAQPPTHLPSYESSQIIARLNGTPRIPSDLAEEVSVTHASATSSDNAETTSRISESSRGSSGNSRFIFSPAGPYSMLLLPAPEDQDTRPLYYITVQQNCFAPLSHITTVYRGANEDAPRIGEFEMGISALPGERQLGNVPPENLEHVLIKMGRSSTSRWRWARHDGPACRYSWIFWNCDVVPYVCSIEDDNRKPGASVARYTPSRTIQRTGASAPLSQLQVTPQGRVIMDDIVMSILAIERRILQPSIKSLFNFS